MKEYIRIKILHNDSIIIINISFIIILENKKNVIENIVSVNNNMDMLEPVKNDMKLIFKFFLFLRLINPATTKDARNKKIAYPINEDIKGVYALGFLYKITVSKMLIIDAKNQ